MFTVLLAMLVVLGVGYRALSPEAREHLVEVGLALIERAKYEARRPRPEVDEFREALRARTRWAFVTPALVALNITIFVLMIFGAGALSDPATLAGWGANFWLNTRNGEWWRLLSSVFVHAGMFQLLINVAALAQIGLILERLVGRVIVVAVFLTAGVFASVVNLVTHPMATSFGASGAIFGLYGLMVASSIWGMRHRSNVTIPLASLQMLAPAAAVFILYNLANDSLGGAADLTGFLTGLVCGTVLARGVSDRKPAARRVAHVTAAAVVIAVLSVIPLYGVTDVKPELERTVAAEARTAGAYQKASERFKSGRITDEALALLIDRTIIPELQVTDTRLKALVGVPKEHEPLVANAERYVQLRSESWRLRSEWLRKAGRAPVRGNEFAQHRANNKTIAQAEDTERAALAALEKVRSAEAAEAVARRSTTDAKAPASTKP